MKTKKLNRLTKRLGFDKMALLLIIVLTLATGGCAGKTNNTASVGSESTKPNYTIRIPNTPYFDLTIIAEEKGFFKEEGITIVRTGQSLGGPDAVTQVVSGGVDIASAAAEPIINAIASGVKIKGIAGGPAFTEERPHMRWITQKDSGINTSKDIIGKKVAVDTLGDCSEFTMYKHFEVDGIPEKDYKGKIQFVVLPPAQEEQALQTRQVDVIILHQPFQGRAFKNPEFKQIYTEQHATGKTYPYVNTFATEKFIKENPEAVKAYVAAIAKAADWNNQNHEEANNIVAPKIGVAPEMIQYMEGQNWGEHALVTDQGTQMIIDSLVSGGALKKDQIKPADVYTNEFNPYYNKT